MIFLNKDKIAKVLDKVSNLKGIVCVADFNHELGYKGKYIDDYLAVSVLRELIDKNIIELKFNEPNNEKDKEKIRKENEKGEENEESKKKNWFGTVLEPSQNWKRAMLGRP